MLFHLFAKELLLFLAVTRAAVTELQKIARNIYKGEKVPEQRKNKT